MRLFYATSAPADMIAAHHSWQSGERHWTEVSDTFSGEVATFVRDVGGVAMFVSGHSDKRRYEDSRFTILHFPKQSASGWRWHVEQIRHARKLLKLAQEFRANVAVIDSGTTYHFALSMFERAGMRVVPVLHNALWPACEPPNGLRRMLSDLDRKFLARSRPIGVSPEIIRQAGAGLVIRPQFSREYFSRISKPEFGRPFNVFFVGRATEDKGLLDIPEMARICGDEVSWTVCGDGPDLPQLRKECEGLPVDIRGWTSPGDQIPLRSASHAAIVPTRSYLAEGLAMTAVEAILSSRPLIASRAVPALEILRPAAEEAEPDDPRSYAEAILRLARDPARWQSRVDACDDLMNQFYDPARSLTAALHTVLDGKVNDAASAQTTCASA